MIVRIVRFGIRHSEIIVFDSHMNRLPSLDFSGTAAQCFVYIKGLSKLIHEVGIESKSAPNYELMRQEFEREVTGI